jgi:hypothetical protein
MNDRDERDEHLRALLGADERVLASGAAGLVTDRRVLFPWKLRWPPSVGGWAHDAIKFEEMTSYREGRLHDERPVLVVQHPEHRRPEWAPAHRFLWSRWGNTVRPRAHSETTFSFAGRRDPVYAAMRARLEVYAVPRGEPFRVSLPGPRRSRRHLATLTYKRGPLRRLQQAARRTAG